MPQRNWLLTGVSSGFGRIMTEQSLARGDRVVGTLRDLSVIHDLKAEYGDRLWLAELDLSEISSIRGLVDRAFASVTYGQCRD
jgi:NADP-dependent 3-hydroxy acid dehydrogenase YdfG